MKMSKEVDLGKERIGRLFFYAGSTGYFITAG